MFSERTELKVGEQEKIRIHSRLKDSLALLTFEGEGIISHQVQELSKGWNDVPFTVDHAHFPNFHISVSVLDGQELRTAGRDFTVTRRLLVSLNPEKLYLPGEEAEVAVTVTDQLGNPVVAELSLALVDEALFAIYPDTLQPITDFFNEGIHRDAAMRTASSCTFSYHAITQRVLKELLEEELRLVTAADKDRDYGEVSAELSDLVALDAPESVERIAGVKKARFAVQPAVQTSHQIGRVAGGRKLGKKAEQAEADFDMYIPEDTHAEAWHRTTDVAGDIVAEKYFFDAGYAGQQISAREEFADAGYWLPVIVTNASGKATATISMPEKTTQWRLTARGCTVETLVGQTTAKTITRKDFFLDIKLPSILTEGDKIRVLARIHNLSDFAGEVGLQLKISVDGRNETNEKLVDIEKNDTTEVVFDQMEIPAGQEAKIEVLAQAGRMTDGISRTIPIRPWGMEYADSSGGVSSGDETVFLQLPEGHKYTSRRLAVSIRTSVLSLISDLAMNDGHPIPRRVSLGKRILPAPGDAGSDLLAAAYALGYLKAAGGDSVSNRALMNYTRVMVARLVVSQKDDGGWSWCYGSAGSDIYASSTTLWALAEARRQGVKVHSETIAKATAYLKRAFAQAQQNDNDAKSVILQALSRVGEADFAYANRLYRNRNEMSALDLAYTALTFANLDRNEIGGEILDVLQSKKREAEKNGRQTVYWPANGKRAWMASEIETTALTLLAMEAITPNSPLVKQAVEYLLSKRIYSGYSPYRAKGPVVAALAIYYGKTQFTRYDFSMKISVNGEEVKSVDVRDEHPWILVNVPSKLIKNGRNRVEFELEGNGEYAYTATLSGFSPDLKDPKSWDKPYVQTLKYCHAPLEYKGRQISSSTSQITQLPDGERTYVSVDIRDGSRDRYLVVYEYLPAGTMLVDDSLSGQYLYHEVGDGMITFYYPPGTHMRDYQYQLVSYAPGTYRALPTVIQDTMRPGDMRMSKPNALELLAPGEKSRDVYRMNDGELYGLGKAYFDDGIYDKALSHLSELYDEKRTYQQREVARMLLWIHTEDTYYDAQKVVQYFEILRERFPELYIPFNKILVVGRAYRDMEEYERAYLVYKATIDASFINDSSVSAVLEDEGQFLSSIDFQENIWREYPDSPQVTSSYFALSQAIYAKSAKAAELGKSERYIPLLKGQSQEKPEKITKLDLLKETAMMLAEFLTLYPNDPLSDDAAFSLANALLDLENFPLVVNLCQTAEKRYPKSEYLTSFQYVEALGYFSQHKYDEAVDAAKIVADGKSKDRDLSRYILGQIYHAQGKPGTAIDWYGKVKDIYPDAQESISYFQKKSVSLDEVKVVRPDKDAKITIKYRNIKEVSVQVYRVNLMKLYLREKDLSKIRAVQLAGISPQFSKTAALGDGKDYVNKEHEMSLELEDEGAYLVICRGDDLFSSGLVLITSLDIEVQEDAASGRVRVNVRDVVKDAYREGVHVKTVGSAEKAFRSGETDLRGLFIADDIRGQATVIAREGANLYAFYRGKQWLGAREEQQLRESLERVPQTKYNANYRANISVMNDAIQDANVFQFDQMRRAGQKGVQVQMAE